MKRLAREVAYLLLAAFIAISAPFALPGGWWPYVVFGAFLGWIVVTFFTKED